MCPELSPAPWKSQPNAGRQVCLILKTCYSTSNFRSPCKKKMYRYSRRRGNLYPRAEKAVSRRRGTVTFIHYRRNIGFSWRRGKLCPAAGKIVSRRRGKVTFIQCRKKMLGFPGAGGSCVPVPGNLFPAPGKAVPRRRESCFLASGKGLPGAGWCDLMWVILISTQR